MVYNAAGSWGRSRRISETCTPQRGSSSCTDRGSRPGLEPSPAPSSDSSRPPPGPTSGQRESDGAGKLAGTQPAGKERSLIVQIKFNMNILMVKLFTNVASQALIIFGEHQIKIFANFVWMWIALFSFGKFKGTYLIRKTCNQEFNF